MQLRLLLALFLSLFVLDAHAQDAMVVQTCGTLPQTYAVGSTRIPTVDVNGKLCLSSSGGGGTPGGTSGQVQYNNAGAFGGITGTFSDGTSLTFGAAALRILGSSTGYTTLESANAGATNFIQTMQATSDTIADLNTPQTWRGTQTFAAIIVTSCTGCSSVAVQPQGRLTLTSATPVMTATQGSTSVIYYDCYHGGNGVSVYNGTSDINLTIGSCEISDTMPTSSTGVTNTTGVFDEWAVNVSGTLTLCHATNGSGGGWASDTGGSNTARGSGYSALDTTTRPYITNAQTITHCYNGSTDEGSLSANKATYLGTFYTSGAGKTQYTFGASASGGTAALFGIWNAYNRVTVATSVIDSGTAYTYTTGTIRQSRASAGNQISYVLGIAEDGILASYTQYGATVSGVSNAFLEFGIGNTSNAFLGQFAVAVEPGGVTGGTSLGVGLSYPLPPTLGLSTIYALERGDGANANAFNEGPSGTLSASPRM